MPELPELEVVKEFLQKELVGQTIKYFEVLKPLVFRNLIPQDLKSALLNKTFAHVDRRGKFLILSLGSEPHLVINPMLSGRLYWSPPEEKRAADTFIIFGVSGGRELRYVDPKTMGKVYLTNELSLVPGFALQGPEALNVSREEFRERIKRYRGEIKGAIIDQSFLAGIGNAYADEILHHARLYPFLRRPRLSAEEVDRLYDSIQAVLDEATSRVRAQMGEEIHLKFREELKVHGKKGEPCPRCGTPISEVKVRNRATNFCRHCQPGIMQGRSRRLASAALPETGKIKPK
ncbi:MAG: Fpg/Nei family DNA glycosylase [Chloroflexi bacterium]|nr:Fpg/Nei family DNA glycosylase [Chloroflexota bacterium]